MTQTVVITGASAGIGRAGGTPCEAEADMADFGQVETAARKIEAELGPVHVWVNCGFTSSLRCELLHERSGIQVTLVQMPAVNTPQFSWVRLRLPRRPQPVPPIYQPEVAAPGIMYAADHPGRKQ